jgi:N-acylneuraminate cytidylyltransferase
MGSPAPTHQTVALVPARGGSKSIPHKNIQLLAGRPLLYWVCLAAERCESVDATFVSTDDPQIVDVVLRLGLEKVRPIERAPETATDTASTESVMLDFASRVKFEHILLLQATSPLTHDDDLRRAFSVYQGGTAADSVLSLVRQRRFFWEEQQDGFVRALNYDPRHRIRRQDQRGSLVENGAFYLTSREHLLQSRCRLSGRIAYVEMPSDTFVELDEPDDWITVEHLLRRRLKMTAKRTPRRDQIRLVATDVDGVLTDSGMYYSESGDELKKFSTRDGKGFELLRNDGLLTCIITGEASRSVERRAAKLRVDEVFTNVQDKVACMDAILRRRGLDWAQVAYVGDDLGDLALLKRVGFSSAPADAVEAVRKAVHLVTVSPGGNGAFREVAEHVLSLRGTPTNLVP